MSGATSAASGVGSRMPHCPSLNSSPNFHARMIKGSPRPAMVGSARFAPASASLRNSGQWIDLGLHRREARHDGSPATLVLEMAASLSFPPRAARHRFPDSASRRASIFGAQRSFFKVWLGVRSVID